VFLYLAKSPGEKEAKSRRTGKKKKKRRGKTSRWMPDAGHDLTLAGEDIVRSLEQEFGVEHKKSQRGGGLGAFLLVH